MKREKLIMINLAMQLLRVLEEVDKDLVVLIHHHFQIFLKIFLETLVEGVRQEDRIIEEMI